MSETEDYIAQRRKKFEEAKAAREAASKAKGGFNTGPIPTFEHLVLEQDKCQVFRLVGNSLEQRALPTDPLAVDRSIMRSDDGGWLTCIWHPDKDWPLRVLMRKLAKYKWVQELNGGKGGKVYENEGCDLLKRFNTNDQESTTPYTTGMEPRKFILMNAIDRMDSYCKDNKHTKLLAWDSQEKDGKKYYTAGITQGLYKYLWETKCTMIGKHFEDIDFVFRRFSKKTKPNDNINYVLYFDENKSEIKNWSDKDKTDYYSKIVSGYLSKEEEAYERYNLDSIPFMSMPTPIGVIMSKMGKFIKSVDEKYGWDIYPQCIAWNEQERKLQAETKASKEEQEEGGAVESSVSETSEEAGLPGSVEVNNHPIVKKVPHKPEEKVGFEFTEEMLNTFEGLGNISEDEKNKISGVDLEEMVIQFSIPADAQCGNCEKMIPDEFTTCPYCATKY
jgi:hypothetical protein